MRRIAIILFATFSFILEASAQRPTTSFNEGWLFGTAGAEELQQVNLPHHYNDDAYLTADYYRGWAQYTKQFFVDPTRCDKRHILYFEGVNSHAKVVLNGQQLKEHKGGYTGFYVDLTEGLIYDDMNTLQVVVDNRNENIAPLSGDFTIFGGIYRPVWWIEKSAVSFALDSLGGRGVQIISREINHNTAKVCAKIKIDNSAASSERVDLQVDCIAPSGEVLFTRAERVRLSASECEVELDLPTINSPMLWSPYSPNLYRFEARLIGSGGELYDVQSESFGLRWIAIGENNSLLLNGEKIKLVGASRHQDRLGYGIALSDKQHFDDIAKIKEMGANFIRLAHYPQSKAVLDACDQLGLMVWEEAPVVDIINDNDEFRDNCERQLREMITQHFNHPSIVLWGYMNEVIIQIPHRIKDEAQREERYAATLEVAKHLNDICKTMDQSRMTVMAYHGSELYNKIGLADVADISGWNLYDGWYGASLSDFDSFVAEQHATYPQRPLIISEFGAGSDKRIHSLKPQKFDFSMEYQQLFMEHYWDFILKNDFVMGGAMWNMIDFSSALRQESMPQTNNKGLLYANREPKDIFYYHKALLNDCATTTHIATRDWSRRKVMDCDSLQEIKVYSNEAELELLIDGRSYGRKKVEGAKASWLVVLDEGLHIIEAVGEKSRDVTKLSLDYIAREIGQQPKVDIHINAGSNAYFYPSGSSQVFVADVPYSAGSWGYVGGEQMMRGDRPGTTSNIRATQDDPLFQTQRHGDMTYRFDLPKGKYRVTLYFADLNFYGKSLAYDLGKGLEAEREPGIFNIEINGVVIEQNYSPADAVGGNTALIKSYEIENEAKQLEIKFSSVRGKAFVNAISVEICN